ncbi:Asp-tRNA(Asn) amidotransferase subunit GatC [Metallosphaera tengchongensis]|uniref:Aspartyl/glutamyl-tRNA(Asn/Gln) amidotransferase subunit C n=1 Tax=Metallosphaera tengchongensis TaxID=1532350 RepID=A0A6N0NW88_9CREN|nr:Asp-tRNA(Asn) amidotransferase subunit GatC [Metallosphaera tengchongensis]QKQ99380.1 Asp-tRNA(Asn) amidotransferase subunit GatC [Metallosphaera tengchongensis]
MKVEVNEELMKKLEKLALISLSDQERVEFMRDLSKILDFFNAIDRVNLEGVEPMFHPVPGSRLRSDSIQPSLKREEALLNVPKKKDGFIIGPSTIGG